MFDQVNYIFLTFLHIWYYFLFQYNNEFASNFFLKDARSYNYLNQSDGIKIEGDFRRLDSLMLAFNVLQVPSNRCNGIFQTLSAILWLGNLTFEDVDGERCQLTKEDVNIVEILSKLLGLEVDNLKQVLLIRQINVRGNITEIPLKLQEVSNVSVCLTFSIANAFISLFLFFTSFAGILFCCCYFRLEKIVTQWLKRFIHGHLRG